MDEAELAADLEKLSVEDAPTVAAYVSGIIAAGAIDHQTIKEALEAFVEDEASRDALSARICTRQIEANVASTTDSKAPGLTQQFKARWANDVSQENGVRESPAPVRVVPRIGLDAEAREATLRLARQIHEKRVEEEVDAELSAKAIADEAEALTAKNRAEVHKKLAQAQAARASTEKKHKEQSREAETKDRKEKAEKKEERRKKAQKGERRGGS
jgi:hypothetical protein